MNPPEKILIIDDEPDMVEILTLGLGAVGYKVSSAYNGDEALDMLKEEKPDPVLLDMILPPRGGMDVLKEIRKEKSLKSMPVILFTAAQTEKEKELITRLGISDCITKPFDRSDLIRRIKEVLKKKKEKSAFNLSASHYSHN